jgi:hypothetical protein
MQGTHRIAWLAGALAAAFLGGCAAGPKPASIRTDGRGLFEAEGRREASSVGVLMAEHDAAESARAFCESHDRRLLLAGPMIDQDLSSGDVVVLVRFRCAMTDAVGQARP